VRRRFGQELPQTGAVLRDTALLRIEFDSQRVYGGDQGGSTLERWARRFTRSRGNEKGWEGEGGGGGGAGAREVAWWKGGKGGAVEGEGGGLGKGKQGGSVGLKAVGV